MEVFFERVSLTIRAENAISGYQFLSIFFEIDNVTPNFQ